VGEDDAFFLDTSADAFSGVIIASGPQHAAALLEHFPEAAPSAALIQALEYEPIVTCYLQYAEQVTLPAPMLGFNGGIVQWVFDRGRLGGPKGLLAAVISASGPHGELARGALEEAVERELRAALGTLPERRWSQVITEKRATFSCRASLARPTASTAKAGEVLAGDYVASDYPGTLESAVRSGIAAAALLA
jgi:predicted NAD/FAD-binding protein